MRQAQSLEVRVLLGHRAEEKQALFLAEREQPFEEMRWPAPVLQASERPKAERSKQARVFETLQQVGLPALEEQPVWGAQVSRA